MIVEDEPLVAEAMTEMLAEAGFAVEAAGSGEAALSALARESGQLRALVTDVNLAPGGMSGWGVAKHARERRPDLPIIYVTGASANDWPVHGVPNSILLNKPFAPVQLVTAIAQLLNASVASPPT